LPGSLDVSTQVLVPVLPHAVVIGGQTHAPPVHCVPPVHALPQLPQLPELCCRSTQTPLQSISPLGQVQVPEVHVAPPVHAMPQPPQFRLSLVASMQLPLQRIWLPLQVLAHVPMLHT
jgi:hypothetical protein